MLKRLLGSTDNVLSSQASHQTTCEQLTSSGLCGAFCYANLQTVFQGGSRAIDRKNGKYQESK